MTKNDYIKSITPGCVIAFNYKDGMYSAKAVSIDNEFVTVQTKNGSMYKVKLEDVTWVKNRPYWPIGISTALSETYKRSH